MRRAAKVKVLATRMPLRKAATSGSAAARRSFPAWITAEDSGVAFPAKAAMPRVRDALVLRTVTKKKPGKRKGGARASGAR